ncbi:hypothetical protein D8674_035334 [Pyrus ussuriensis x Pyrus communis]|uniref:Uncharacterized protein n=1 Tax=Pyrus ussuriensis x Pyrus communis TaxID=2448454 RepID=A0A5N5GCI9_9ROSA|nr:hypothetical protein D8674_035334 [Pyrus ussuriensis x Pyrus communis]
MFARVNESEWVQKMELYRKWGWTEDDFLLAFRKNPQIMELAEKNFSSKMDFLVNKMGWHPADVAGSSVALNYSLEKYIIRRCLVIRVLLSKGLVSKGEFSLGTLVRKPKQYFLDRLVIKYQEQVPELLSIFEGKLRLTELGLGFEQKEDGVKQFGNAVHDGLRAVKNTVEDVAVALSAGAIGVAARHYLVNEGKKTIQRITECISQISLLETLLTTSIFLSLYLSHIDILNLTHEVPETSISYWVSLHPFLVSLESDKFKENVKKVTSMGVPPSSATFMRALYMFARVNESERVQKMELYRKWGWTEDDFLLVFRKNPQIMELAEKNFSSKMDFLVNKVRWQPADVAGSPIVLVFIIRILMSKGLIVKGEFSMATLLGTGKDYFLDRFVVKYQEQVPELPSIFKVQMVLSELGLGFEQKEVGVKQL